MVKPYRIELDQRYRVVSPAEVWRQAQQDRKAELAAKPKPAPLPPPPWWYTEYLSGGTEIGVGEGRALMAAAARKEACWAFGISKYDLPPLRFASHPPIGAPDDLRGWFQPSLSGGTVCVLARQSLMATAVATVHECVHFHQSRKLGPLVDIGREVANNPSHPLEREARSAHQDFERYMKQAWDICDTKLDEQRLLYWAKQVLYGKPRAEWTAPSWL